uniref:VWFA domain-containing protein n=1 Tax=uncultured Chromatiales bacterium HF0200_41F04 TaxID=710740 RepID=E0XV09_9GAMM|nr:hypothetical protein [uncultured Chromatiales bacterium HF0200_41F04]
MRPMLIWSVLFGISLIVHTIISWQIGQDIGNPLEPPEEVEINIAVAEPPPEPLERPKPEDPLLFEEEFEIEPPDKLIAPEAVTAPAPDAPLALRADSGGTTGFDLPNPLSSLPLGEGFGTAGFGGGIGNALGNSNNRFASFISDLRTNGLDVVFVVDATGSMGWAIDEIKDRIYDIVSTVRTLVPAARFGFVAFRDHNDPEFLVRSEPLTFSTAKLHRFLDPLQAAGGGDIWEEVNAGIAAGIDDSGWRVGARRIIILVGDAPPREESFDELLGRIHRFTANGGTLSTLDVSPSANPGLIEIREGRPVNRAIYRGKPMREFLEMTEAGKGDAGTLHGDVKVTKRLITLIMGEQFANEMRALLEVI